VPLRRPDADLTLRLSRYAVDRQAPRGMAGDWPDPPRSVATFVGS